ncbi:putative ribonuclease H-like domain-containing protein [Tanacetum coccineum]
MHINFLEDQPKMAGSGPDWMFDIDLLTNTMYYIPICVENQVNMDAEDVIDKEGQHQMLEDEQVLHDELEKMVTQELTTKAMDDVSRQAFEEEKRRIAFQKKATQATSTNKLSTDRPSVCTNRPFVNTDRQSVSTDRPFVSTDRSFVSIDRSFVSTANTPYVSAASTSTGANAGESSFIYLGGKIPIYACTLPNVDLPIDSNMPNLEETSDTLPNDRIFNGAYDDDKDVSAVADFNNMDNTIAVSPIPILRIHKDHPKGQILGDPTSAVQIRGVIQKASSAQQALVEAMQEELLQFKLQKVWVLVDLPYGKKCISLLHFVDLAHPNKVYKVIKTLYGLHQASRAWYETLSSFLMENGFRREFEECMHKRFQMSSMGELTFFLGLQVKQQPDGIFISQDKYVADILKKFDFLSIRTATTPIESNKPLVKDEDGVDVDVHVYRSMIGSLMYLTTSRPDIMFVVCACARFQVSPKASHLNAVKRIFMYLKHQPKLGLWYPRDLPFKLEAYSDTDYGGASLDKKSITGGCQFLRRRLIYWQCKKQTIMANSTIEAEYVAAANCYGQVLWIQNQMMDYGFNFMNTKIHIDNESTISVIKNPVAHSRTKHIEIRFHFIRDCYEKRLIEVIKIHTYSNVADLLTKGFDVTRFNFLVLTKVSTDRLKVSTDRQSLYRYKAIRENTVQYGGLFGKDGWEYRVSSYYGLSHRTVNNISYIDVTVVGNPVTILEALIRSDLLFDDADGIDSLNNQAIFDNIQLMVQLTEDEGEASERPSDSQPIPTPPYPEGFGGNHGGHSSNDIPLSGNEDGLGQEAKEKSQTTYHTSQILDDECFTEDKIGKKDFFEEKIDPAFDDLDDIVDDIMDYMEYEDAQDEERTSSVVLEEKENADKEVKTEAPISTVKPNEGTDKRNECTGKQDGVLITISQNKQKEKEKGVEIRNVEDTERPRPTSTRSILTLRPLPKIDPKDKGKKRIEEEDESDTESENITEAEKKFKQLANDEEVARKVQEEWQDLMLTRYLLKSFKRKRERCILLSREPNFFMTPLLPKEDFLLNKDLKLSEINLLQEISLGTK